MQKLGGQPFENQDRAYSGSSDDTALNQSVARHSADAAALAAIDADYETSGSLNGPLVTVHTTNDPLVPSWHVQRYRTKISGPLLDRIDIHVEVPSVRYQELASLAQGEPSSAIRERVVSARRIQQARFGGNLRIHCNADMGSKELQNVTRLEQDAQDMLKMAITELNFSARAYDRILKVSRTIADLEACETIQSHHVSEAIQYRSLDREMW